jgi:GNAT superfamily N-acetyltransferase
MAHRPHDFAAMLPKVYGEGAPLFQPDKHFIAREDGRIRALVAMLPVPARAAGRGFTVGFIGTVSTHPYYRGRGGMKHLMAMAMDTARREGYAYMALGGRRQRYGYFGFTPAGVSASHLINGDNVRHALGGIDSSRISFKEITDSNDPLIDIAYGAYDRQIAAGSRSRENFLIICQSWGAKLYAVNDGGACVGYAVATNDDMVSELVLEDSARYAKPFFKAWYAARGGFKLRVPTFDIPLQQEAESISEGFAIDQECKLRVLDWETTLGAALALKRAAQPMPDGRWTIQIDGGEPLTMEVAGADTSVSRSGRDIDASMTSMQAQEAVFSMKSLLFPVSNAPQGWFPLALGRRSADDF